MDRIAPNTINVLVILTKLATTTGNFVTNTDKTIRNTHKLTMDWGIFITDTHKHESSLIECAVDLDKVTTKLCKVVTKLGKDYAPHRVEK